MASYPSVEDLRLVDAVHRLGSLGAAARELLVAQPSASARLAALERRLGVALFERDTTGARATPAGRAFAAEAVHILRHLAAVPERTLAGAAAPLLRVGTFPSLAALLFPALDEVLGGSGVVVDQRVDHGDNLVEDVAAGALDVAVVGLAGQVALPHGVSATPLGRDRLVALVPDGAAPPGRGRHPLSGIVPFHAVDLSGPGIETRISALGGTGRRAATAEVAILTARRAGAVALVSGAIAGTYRAPGDRVVASPVAQGFAYQLVTRVPAPDVVARRAPQLAAAMGLDPA